MLRLVTSILAALLLMSSTSGPTVEDARKAIRPSLGDVCKRASGHLAKGDWVRVELSLSAVGPIAVALDARWRTKTAPGLERALESKDTLATLSSLASLVYWDARDLLTPVFERADLEPAKVKTRFLKAIQDLRYLAPVIKATQLKEPDGKPIDGNLLYSRLEKRLVNAVSQVPTEFRFLKHSEWRKTTSKDAEVFLGAIMEILPELHEPTDPKGRTGS